MAGVERETFQPSIVKRRWIMNRLRTDVIIRPLLGGFLFVQEKKVKKHIVIVGKRQVGKSTLIRKLLDSYDGPIYGFRTAGGKSMRKGYRSFFIFPYSDTECIESEENHIGDSMMGNGIFNEEAFNGAGLKCLETGTDGIIVMDELGFMESQAENFCNRVLELMDGDIPIIIATKTGFEDNEFLNAVKSHPNADVYYIDEENRDLLYEQLRNEIPFK